MSPTLDFSSDHAGFRLHQHEYIKRRQPEQSIKFLSRASGHSPRDQFIALTGIQLI